MRASGAAPEGSAALVLPSFGSGGAERVVLNLAAGLTARGRSVRLVVIDGRGPLRAHVPRGVDVVDLGRSRARSAVPALLAELRSRPVELLIGSQTHVNVLLGLLRPSLPRATRLVLREPNLLPGRAGSSLAERAVGRALGRADLVVASSPAMQERLVAHVRGPARVLMLANPVDEDALRSSVDPGLATLAGTGGTVRLVTVGRLTEQKAHDDLLHALALAPASVTLTVIGDGPRRRALEALTAELDLSGRVRLLGRIDDPRHLASCVASADAMVHPARFEGMPNAVLEALALGTPVIATTDLRVLDELAAEVGPHALRLVPRADLAGALGELATAGRASVPGPSLLPARFRSGPVVDALLVALGGPATRSGA